MELLLMVTRRQKRIEELLRDEIGRVVRRELGDNLTPFLSITSVEVTKDLSMAKVYVSFLNDRDAKGNLAKLERAGGFIRSEMNKVLRMKRIPKLYFRRDVSIAKAFKLEEVFSRIRDNDECDNTDNSEED